MKQIRIQIVHLLLVILLWGCFQRSNDEIPEIEQLWQSDSYLLEKDGDSRELLLKQADILIQRADYQDAWSLLSRDVFRLVSDPELAFLRGKVQYHLGNPQVASRYLQDARELGYSGDELFYLIAANELKLGNKREAIEAVNTLLDLQVKPEFISLKGDVRLESGDTVLAEREYLASMKMDSSLRSNYKGLTTIYLNQDDETRAMNMIDSWLKKSPDDPDFLLSKGQILFKQGKYQEASVLFSSLPGAEQPEILALRSENYLKMGQPDSSAIMAQKILLLNSNDISARLLLAKSLENQRLYDEAEASYQMVYDADSTIREAEEALDRLERRRSYLRYLRQQEEQILQAPPPQPNRMNVRDSVR